ncbi:hypothetical protein [Streptomyces sp. NPDC058989]|uniref:hypothetical protein n=1 Tax=Streptomyces sp. NPDC058989 TaxID=3346686 RepID=UPI00367DDE3B
MNPRVKNPDLIHPGYKITVTDKGTEARSKAKPVVSLAHIRTASVRDPGLRQAGTTYPVDVRHVEAALKEEGLLDARWASDGSFGSVTRIAYANWQKRARAGGPPDAHPRNRLASTPGHKARVHREGMRQT